MVNPGTSASPGVFSQMKQVMPLYGGSAFVSVLTRTKTTPDSRPLVTHIFCPLISQFSPTFLVVDLLGDGEDLVVGELADHLGDRPLLVGQILMGGYGHGSSGRWSGPAEREG